jgi:AraC-like DNA-binding protein
VLQLEDHRSELGQWRTAQRAADPRLRAYVRGYVGSSSRLHLAVQERHVPSVEVPLLLNFGTPHRRFDANGSGAWTDHDGVWVVGLHTCHQLTMAAGEREFMVVRFTPFGAHLFLGLPLHAIANDAVDLALIDAALARRVVSRIFAAGNWGERFAAMDALIAERLNGQAIPAAIDAWRRLAHADGRLPIGALVSQAGCSPRTLIAGFERYVGLSPKRAARVLRFNRVLRALDRRNRASAGEPVGKPYLDIASTDAPRVRSMSWVDLAAYGGYVDQAHLIKEFRQFTGRSPVAFLDQASSRV